MPFLVSNRKIKYGIFTTYIVDEFQHLDLSVVVEKFLRKGRNFGASMILSSQYVGKGQKKYMSALKQSANQMFFRPVDSDVKALAELIDSEHVQEWDFLEFVKQDKHFNRYYDGIYILFHTGVRVSEFCGLTLWDIDLENKVLNIDPQLQRTSDMRLIVESTKTKLNLTLNYNM